jgi:4-hydroxy-3-methylbut-2-enyl diphosphate reductase
VIVEIDRKSGFCFGVVKAIGKAEEMLKKEDQLYALGSIVHNDLEVKRLRDLGLIPIKHEEFFKLRNCKVLIRTHGEPPSTYEYAMKNNITLIDATCPVVLKLQQRVKKASEVMLKVNGQVVIFGHKGHAEVTGLVGQTNDEAIIIEDPEQFNKLDPERPVIVFSQTTKSVNDFKILTDNLKSHFKNGTVETHDTICRQVSNRIPHLTQFAAQFDVVIFAGGQHSSNAKVLFNVCKAQNEKSYFISSAEEIQPEWFAGAASVGICGATSTPQWLMEKVADRIKQF